MWILTVYHICRKIVLADLNFCNVRTDPLFTKIAEGFEEKINLLMRLKLILDLLSVQIFAVDGLEAPILLALLIVLLELDSHVCAGHVLCRNVDSNRIALIRLHESFLDREVISGRVAQELRVCVRFK